jgi:hypothetical protein
MQLIRSKLAGGLITVALGWPTLSLAQESEALLFAQTFIGTCVQNLPDTDRVKAAAKAFGWVALDDPNYRKMMGPPDERASWTGWTFKEQGKVFAVGVSEGEANGKPVRMCTLVQDRIDVDGTISKLTELLQATKLQESVEAGQRYVLWQFKRDETPYLLVTLDGSPMNIMMLNASVSTDFR